ncbi:hypothetical protein [Parvibaculum sp.]|uniref:hypothetical protein n=1 Tax=Parvibaculum sp. TaxID=2024848 RepID=UPI003BA971F4
MLKSVFTTIVFAMGLAFASLALNPSPVAAAELASVQADISTLVAQYQDDPDGLEAAIEEYVTNSEDPELAAQAIIAVAAGLPDDSPLKIALGRGLGAAIVVIGLTSPTVAANMQALVAASNDEALIASVSAGSSDKTASIEQNTGGDGNIAAGQDDETPETFASPS